VARDHGAVARGLARLADRELEARVGLAAGEVTEHDGLVRIVPVDGHVVDEVDAEDDDRELRVAGDDGAVFRDPDRDAVRGALRQGQLLDAARGRPAKRPRLEHVEPADDHAAVGRRIGGDARRALDQRLDATRERPAERVLAEGAASVAHAHGDAPVGREPVDRALEAAARQIADAVEYRLRRGALRGGRERRDEPGGEASVQSHAQSRQRGDDTHERDRDGRLRQLDRRHRLPDYERVDRVSGLQGPRELPALRRERAGCDGHAVEREAVTADLDAGSAGGGEHADGTTSDHGAR
jgi:hypothetical protein